MSIGFVSIALTCGFDNVFNGGKENSMTPKALTASLVSMILVGILFFVGVSFLLPWKMVSWGKIGLQPINTVTVVGEAKSQEKTQIAMFSAGVNAFGDDKQAAVNDVNKKVDAIIQAVKEFGVKADDIKTQSLNMYQNQEQYYEDGRQKTRAGQWNVSNTIEVKLTDVDRAAALASVLTKSGATNVNGPNFSFDDTTGASNDLFDQALKNAAEKAGIVAQSSARKLGKVVSVTEGYAPAQTFYRMEGGGGGGGGIEPGSGTVNKTVTVMYELEL
ncbi:MAG: SIMPL domain-containing protein [Patescibacteria group bacterium]